jgi:hypothetical protein
MKTLMIFFALVSGTQTSQANIPSVKMTGLHFVVTTEVENMKAEFSDKICDTLNENVLALFKSKDYILTCRNRNEMEEKGIQSEVKAYFNDEEITMDDAYVMMNNRNIQEAKEYAEYSRSRIKEIMNEYAGVNLFYSITVSMANDKNILSEYTKEYVHTMKENGKTELLNIGKFITFTDVKSIYDELIEKGISNISITASEFGKDIPVSNAVGKEQYYLEQLLAINK